MLTVFHTADWHLGQSFCGFDRDVEHAHFLTWLIEQIADHRPDALLLAGDVFDSVNPSAQAQARFYDFLAATRTVHPAMQLVIIAGNHDASARLEAPAALLDSLNITVVGTVQKQADGEIALQRLLVPIHDSSNSVAAIVAAVPFLRPSDVPGLPDADDPYLDGIAELYRQVTEAAVRRRTETAPDAALLAMGHCHLSGGSESPDSERRLIVGGAEAIPPAVFDSQLAYVALGHLHRAQQADGGRIRYSGSPIPLSFAERTYQHQIFKLTLDRQDLSHVETIPVPRHTALLSIPATGSLPVEDLLPQLERLQPDPETTAENHPFLEVRVREDSPDPTRRTRIEQALADKPVRLASIKTDRGQRREEGDLDDELLDVASLQDIQPLDVFTDAWREKYNSEPEPAVVEALREILLQESHSS